MVAYEAGAHVKLAEMLDRSTDASAMAELPHLVGLDKVSKIRSTLKPHQQAVVDVLQQQSGVLAAHGVGTGKTLSSIAAAHSLGMPIEAVVPASLQENYLKELTKHVSGKQPARVRSYEKATTEKEIDPNALMVLDEAHRIRNAMGTRSRTVHGLGRMAKKRLALTGSPVYNRPADIASLVNFVAGKDVLPTDPKLFNKMFIGERQIMPSLMAQLRGVQPGVEEFLRNDPYLFKQLKKYVLYEGPSKDNPDFPTRTDEVVHVPMSKVQSRVYSGLLKRLPIWAQYKFKKGLPPSKQESKELNAFMGGVRQASNTPTPFLHKLTPEDEREHTPKINAAVEDIKKRIKANPRHRAVVYTNYVDSGVRPLSQRLREHGIAHKVFKGGMPRAERKAVIEEFNKGKTPVLAITSAGTEGLDLKGVRAVHILEPHFNQEKIEQAIGRARRYKSHAHLPEDERKVRVMHYAAQPRAGLLRRIFTKTKSTPGVDEYLMAMAARKGRLGSQLRDMMEQATAARMRTLPHLTN